MKILFSAAILLSAALVLAAPLRTTYQAKIIKPDGLPLQAASVNFRFSILDPAASCVIYIEDYAAVNMHDSGGLIAFSLGAGVRSFPTSGTASTFYSMFDNSTVSFPCQTPGVYIPSSIDSRKIVMQFNDGGGWQTLPAMSINAVPYAMYAGKSENAIQLNGKSDSAFVEYSTLAGLSCASDQAIKFNGVSFSCITVAASGGTVTSGSVISALGYTPADGVSVTALTSNISSVSGSVSSLQSSVAASFSAITSSQWVSNGSAVYYNDGYVGIGTSNPTAMLEINAPVSAAFATQMKVSDGDTGGYFSVSDGSSGLTRYLPTFEYSSASVSGYGGVLVGKIPTDFDLLTTNGAAVVVDGRTASNTVITNANLFSVRNNGAAKFIIQASGTVGIGTSTPVTKLDVNGGVRISMESAACAVSYAGTLRYNAGTVEYCNGTTWSAFGVSGAGLQSFNGSTSGTQSFAIGAGGTAPVITTANGVHTFSIPNAASATVTSGLLSNADYMAFTNKLDATSAAVISALAYTPASASSVANLTVSMTTLNSTVSSLGSSVGAIVSSQWNTSGTTINYMNGNVGIGTTAPSAALEVSGGIKLSGTVATLDIPETTSTTGYITMNGDSLLHASEDYSIFLGRRAGNLAGTGVQDTGIGHKALKSITFGYQNVAVGDFTMTDMTTGGENTAIGSEALTNSVSGIGNVAVGIQTLMNNMSDENTVVGAYALNRNGNGSKNTGTGYAVMNMLTTGSNNVAAGWMALRNVDTGSSNIAIGYNAGSNITTGSGNVVIGGNTGATFATDSNNISINDGVGNERIRVVSSGLVGIGTTTPVTKLDVSGAIRIGMDSVTCSAGYAGTIRYNSGSVEMCNGTIWSAFGIAGAGIVNFNGSTSGTQTFANGTAGNAPAFVTANGFHTLNIPYASVGTTTAGLISNADYVNFKNKLSTLDLGGVSATGTLAIARMPAFIGDATIAAASNTIVLSNSGVTAGTFTKVTVDAKGRVTSGSDLLSSDVTAALGYTPASASASTQWNTSGTTINYTAGDVGIGTTSPQAALDVVGQIAAGSGHTWLAGNIGILPIPGNATLLGTSVLGWNASNGQGETNLINAKGPGSPGGFTFDQWDGSSRTTRMVIHGATGYVGIGTTAPYSPLQVAFNSVATTVGSANSLKIQNTDSTNNNMAGLIFNEGTASAQAGAAIVTQFEEHDTTPNSNLIFYTQGGSLLERMRIASSGSVGIGTANPLVKLHVNEEIAAIGSSYPSMFVMNTSKADGTYGKTWGWMNYGSGFHLNGYAATNSAVAPGAPVTAISVQDTTGNVGIGTNNPSGKLDVASADSDTRLNVVNQSSTVARYPGMTVSNYAGAAGGWPVFSYFSARGTQAAPTATAANDVLGELGFWGYSGAGWVQSARVIGMANSTFSGANGESFLAFQTTASGSTTMTEKMRISGGGSVGIATTNPSEALQVGGGTNSGNIALQAGSSNVNDAGDIVFKSNTGVEKARIYSLPTAGGGLSLSGRSTTSNSDIFIDSAGRVGIATVSPDPASTLHVNGDARINAIIGGQLNGSGNFHLDAWSSGADRSVYLNWSSGTGGAKIGNGSAAYGPIAASAFNTSSDRRLKENIRPIPYALEKVMQIEAVTFTWKDKTRNQQEGERLGLIAQNVEKIFPQAVKTDRGENTLPGGTRLVTYPDLVAPIIAAIKEFYSLWSNDSKELHSTIEKQNREIASVKEENSQIKADNVKMKKENEEIKARLERLEKVFAK